MIDDKATAIETLGSTKNPYEHNGDVFENPSFTPNRVTNKKFYIESYG